MPVPQILRQIMFFREEQNAHEIGQLVSVIFEECARYFEPAGIFAGFEMHRIFPGSTSAAVQQWLPRSRATQDSEPSERSWREVKGRFRNTVDPAKLISTVKSQLPPDNGLALIITDQEITPPPQWRYKMWAVDSDQNAILISFVSMDPRYWSSERVGRDLLVLKQRIRAACIRKLAKWCGLRDCSHEKCYLFKDVESADALDYFVTLGGEHGVELPQLARLFDCEFEPSTDPFIIQRAMPQRFHGAAFYA
jgi:hypothetical protein